MLATAAHYAYSLPVPCRFLPFHCAAFRKMKENRVDCRCTRKRRAETSPFFELCNRIAFEHGDNNIFFYTIEPNHAVAEDFDAAETSTQMQPNDYTYPCSVPGCAHSFTTMTECEHHFDAQHAHQCATCYEVFSTSHLLELHLQEVHDSYFQALLEKQQASYECLVQSCPLKFSTPDQRLEHLQRHHGYPKWFRFHPVKTRNKLLKKKQTWIRNHHRHSAPPISRNNKMQVDRRNKAKRRELQKQKRATIPCRYFSSKEGCWRGESCMFLHETNDEDVDMMDSLANEMQDKAQVTVPEKISFGRRRRGFFY
jgi:hypothetical protein